MIICLCTLICHLCELTNMLRLQGTSKTLCDGMSRRDLLHIGGLGALGIGLADAMGQQPAFAGDGDLARSFGKAKSCILIFPYGSPSSHETFDPKPEAPVEVQGEMKSIATKVPGTHICEYLPNIADVMNELTVVRSMTHPYPLHAVAYALTGLPTYSIPLETNARDPRHWPFMGSVVDYIDSQRQAGNAAPEIPRNIGLPWLVNSKTDMPNVNGGLLAAFLGGEYDPHWTDFDGPGTKTVPHNNPDQTKLVNNPFHATTSDGRFHMGRSSNLPQDVSIERLRLRRSLLAQFDRSHRQLDANGQIRLYSKQQQLALSLLTTTRMREALDIGREPRKVREAYGMTLFGQSCLAARRIVEAGGRFVSVFWDCFEFFAGGAWDTHHFHYPRLKNVLLPGFNQTYPALINDLRERGMLDETLVIWMSEHGRTPKIVDTRKGGGRDHWSKAYSVALAGGGIAQGKIVGQTTRDGGEVLDNPVSPKDIQATTYHLLGIDPQATMFDSLGKPHPIAGSGKMRSELLA